MVFSGGAVVQNEEVTSPLSHDLNFILTPNFHLFSNVNTWYLPEYFKLHYLLLDDLFLNIP